MNKMTSKKILNVLRTPEEVLVQSFQKGWKWGKPSYFVSKLFASEVRIAYWDIGPKDAKETLLLTHGEPSWSFLYRRMIDPLLHKGYRVVLFDQVGFGWSDKPAEATDYTYERHVAWNEDLLWNHLELKKLTAVLQDWGGLIGLRVAARSPHRYERLVLTNTVLPTCDKSYEGESYISQGFYSWKDFVHNGGLNKPGAVGKLMSRSAKGPSCGPSGELSLDDIEGYQLPFPDDRYLAGVKQFPELVPTPPDDPTGRAQPEGGEVNRAMWNVFEAWNKPVLLAFSDSDPVLGSSGYIWEDKCPGTKNQPHVTLNGAGHFSQDGGAEQLLQAIFKFIPGNKNQSNL
mmetsp:Transcript_15083/g.18282  ORF Transcript_15083/g.18282 Transcript_15083/m.18282 type:complete len:344 (+) Transcript_15083:1908-2939(+)